MIYQLMEQQTSEMQLLTKSLDFFTSFSMIILFQSFVVTWEKAKRL